MALIWSGDFDTGNLSQYNGWEYGGTFDGTPPLSDRLTVAQSIDGISPVQGNYFARLQVAPGDQYGGSTGWRMLGHMPDSVFYRTAGYDSTFVFACRWPSSYPSDADIYVSGFEVHHTGNTVAPSHFRAFSDHIQVDVFGGIQDNTLKTTFVNQSILQNYAKDTWYVFALRYLNNTVPNGIYELWYGKYGTDNAMTRLINATGIGTMYDGGYSNYMLWGLYRNQTGTSTTTMYFDALREYSTLNEALAYANSILTNSSGSGVPPPPPPNLLAAYGSWTTPKLVNSITASPSASSYGSWSTPLSVNANSSPTTFDGTWTTPNMIDTRNPGVDAAPAGSLTLVSDAPESKSFSPASPGSLTLTPASSGAL